MRILNATPLISIKNITYPSDRGSPVSNGRHTAYFQYPEIPKSGRDAIRMAKDHPAHIM